MKRSRLLGAICACIVSFGMITSAGANQVDGCYRIAAGSELRMYNPASQGGGPFYSAPLSGALVGRTDNSYSIDVEETSPANTVIKRLIFSSIVDDRQNRELVATGKVIALQDYANPWNNIVWRWKVTADPATTPGIVDRFTLEPIDSDGDGVIGHKLDVPTNYNLALFLKLESIGADTNKLKGCHRFTGDSGMRLLAPSGAPDAGTIYTNDPLQGTLMSMGDGTYRVIPDPDTSVLQRNFRNVTGSDDAQDNRIQLSGRFSNWGNPEESLSWTWNIDAIPGWSTGPDTFNLASEDSDGDGITGVQMGGPTPLAPWNLALDVNIEPVEVRPNENGPYQVGSFDYDEGTVTLVVPENNDSYPNTPIAGTLHYPKAPGGGIASGGPFPVVVFAHGNYNEAPYGCTASGGVRTTESFRGFDYLLDRLASHGFVALSINLSDLGLGPINNIEKIAAKMRVLFEHLGVLTNWNTTGGDPLGIFQNQLDLTHIGLVGHSQGGGSVELAEFVNRNEGLGYGIKAVVSFAQAAPVDELEVPRLILHGSLDGGLLFSGMETFNRAQNSTYPVSANWFYGGRHTYFNTQWTDEHLSGLGRQEGPFPGIQFTTICGQDNLLVDPAVTDNEIAPERQLQLTETTVSAFFRHHVAGDSDFARVFNGELPLYGTHTIENYWGHIEPQRLMIDDFDTAPGVALSSSGGTVNHSVGLVLAEEINYGPYVASGAGVFAKDPEGTVLVAQWTSPQSIEWAVNSPNQDISGFGAITFHASQFHDAGEGYNSQGIEKDLSVELVDLSGSQAAVSLFEVDQGIPYPSELVNATMLMNRAVLTSVRIPLSKFAASVDLSQITAVRLKMNGTGWIAIDGVQFTN